MEIRELWVRQSTARPLTMSGSTTSGRYGGRIRATMFSFIGAEESFPFVNPIRGTHRPLREHQQLRTRMQEQHITGCATDTWAKAFPHEHSSQQNAIRTLQSHNQQGQATDLRNGKSASLSRSQKILEFLEHLKYKGRQQTI
ncbi:uncharacterized protein LOC143898288 isoform X3 [Temnothorax americanus]|uniref:uncharacterized protein LOC143898288 isoform X3 n=1 Tax=Temnothorax americanus TaxID=1964332 RepID=UPI00406910DF